jgi:hypothetical protein
VNEEPLAPPVTIEEQQSLIRTIRRVESFALFFLIFRTPRTLETLSQTIQETFPNKTMTWIRCAEPVTNFLAFFRDSLPKDASQKPDILFVSGLENWMGSMPPNEQLQVITNLNANRNSLETLVNQSFILCLPEHLLPLFAIHAPDLFSIRSNIFRFLEIENTGESESTTQVIGDPQGDWASIQGLTLLEKENIIIRLKKRLADPHISLLEQINLSNLLARYFYSLAKYEEAEPLFRKAIQIAEETLTGNRSDLAKYISSTS